MGVRKNAKFLTATETENFVRACVLMKADIVNPGAPANQQYSRWDEYTAVHRMIQDAFAPSTASVNFGHGGSGRYSFLSWHRYFLVRFELELQSHVPGVMLPYWDWTDPGTIMTDDFLGPDGAVATNEVLSGYFGADAPGTPGGTNPTPAPPWWPAGLLGWRLPAFAGFTTHVGPLRRNLSGLAGLPTATNLREALAMGTYHQFQNALESGAGLTSFQPMHNGLHGWIGGHMSSPVASPHDPIFYLHHCNIDRLWAMWQADGHADEYPLSGGAAEHHRNDLMYPWVGATPGYGTNAPIASSIPMPDFSALGPQTNGATLDFRTAYGYTYDTIAVIGIGLDRTGSMLQLTPDPMGGGAPDVTKWEAAKRGVSAFLQDAETVQQSATTYVIAGVQTFRRLVANEFTNVLPAPGFGLVKPGGAHGRAAFDSAVASLTPSGQTPLADALVSVHATLVTPPFGGVPADERRYLAMLTDGVNTAGAPLNSIPDGSLTNVAVFGLGFGTPADVDYATIASLVAKGSATLPTMQVFHGENAGTIDKFYSDSLAAAIGFTAVIDPVIELYAGEHAHLDFYATAAEDAFYITVQGMDFDDDNWTYHLHGPDGSVVHGDQRHAHAGAGHGCRHCCHLDVTALRANGRLSLVVNRNNSDEACWVGKWQLMISYRARGIGAMSMLELGALLVPVQAGPPRGPRYARLLMNPKTRPALRGIHGPAANALDDRVVSTNRDGEMACNVLVNIYARTSLRLNLHSETPLIPRGHEISMTVHTDIDRGAVHIGRTFARLLAPKYDLAALVRALGPDKYPRDARLKDDAEVDTGRVLAQLERRKQSLSRLRDVQLKPVQHGDGPVHVHFKATNVPGPYHVGVYVEGAYCPAHGASTPDHTHGHEHPDSTGLPPGCGPDCRPQRFSRILTASVAVIEEASE
jgi:hypothetical protein